jgi:hypothetical protein
LAEKSGIGVTEPSKGLEELEAFAKELTRQYATARSPAAASANNKT